MKKKLLLIVVPVMMVFLIQCASIPKMWPANERRSEDRMFALQQKIGNGLALGEITPNEAQNLLAKLENLRKEYTVLRERRTLAGEWDPFLGRLNDIENEVSKVRAQPSRIDETKIEDRMIVFQRRINEGIMAGRLTRVQGRELQLRLDTIRRDFLQQIKDRPLTLEERLGLSSRLDMLEVDINRVW